MAHVKKIIMSLTNAKAIVREAKSLIRQNLSCRASIQKLIRSKNSNYDVSFFYQQLKPFALGEKEMSELESKPWLIQNKKAQFKKGESSSAEAVKRIKDEIKTTCGGDPDLYEKTIHG